MNYNSLPQGVRLAVEAAQNKKAAAISVLDLSGVGAFTSYFVICTGFSTPQVQAICTEVEEQLYKELGRSPEHREGRASSEWALLDFGSFIVHVFSEQARHYYDLETTTSKGCGARRRNWQFPMRKEHPATRLSEMWRWAVRMLPEKRFQNDGGAAAVDLGGPGVAKCF